MPFRTRLRGDLAKARKANDTETVSLIRILIAAIDNAEAVDHAEAEGVTEMPRRALSEVEILRIIVSECNELRHAADEYERRGHGSEGERLRALAEVADRYARAFDEDRT